MVLDVIYSDLGAETAAYCKLTVYTSRSRLF